MIFYSMVDDHGIIVRKQYTTNSQAAVLKGHRLLADVVPEVDLTKFRVEALNIVPSNATKIEYQVTALTEEEKSLIAAKVEWAKQNPPMVEIEELIYEL